MKTPLERYNTEPVHEGFRVEGHCRDENGVYYSPAEEGDPWFAPEELEQLKSGATLVRLISKGLSMEAALVEKLFKKWQHQSKKESVSMKLAMQLTESEFNKKRLDDCLNGLALKIKEKAFKHDPAEGAYNAGLELAVKVVEKERALAQTQTVNFHTATGDTM